MPYLSHNYRFQLKPKIQSLADAVAFMAIAVMSLFIAMIVLGWFSATAVTAVNVAAL